MAVRQEPKISLLLLALIFLLVQLTPQKLWAESSAQVAQPVSLAELSEEIKARNPDAQIKVVSPAELDRYKKKPGCGPEPDPLPLEVQATPTPQAYVDPHQIAGYRSAGIHHHNDYWLGSSFDNLGSLDGKDLLVVVAVVGAFVVAALFIYSASYLYQASAAGFDCKAYDEVGLRFSYLQDTNSKQSRIGRMHGAYYTLGYDVSFGTLGLTAEVGQHRIDLGVRSADVTKRLEGAYAMAGPSFGFPISNRGDIFLLELLAGTSTHKEIGLMSNIRLGLDFAAGDNLRLGANVGAGMIDIRGFDGYLTDVDQLSYLFGLQLGFRF